MRANFWVRSHTMWADFVFDCFLSSVSLWADFIVFFVLLLQTAHVGINKAWLRTDDLVPPISTGRGSAVAFHFPSGGGSLVQVSIQ